MKSRLLLMGRSYGLREYTVRPRSEQRESAAPAIVAVGDATRASAYRFTRGSRREREEDRDDDGLGEREESLRQRHEDQHHADHRGDEVPSLHDQPDDDPGQR